MFIGHQKEISFLNKIVNGGHADHAYIFSGPEKIGKFLLARIFAKSMIEAIVELNLNATDRNIFLPDLMILEPEVEIVKGVVKEKIIPVEKIREVEKNLSLYPYSGKCKVFVINNAHKMSVQSQNALLKTLEELNSQSILILVTHQIETILPTIISRCQILRFNLVSNKEIENSANVNDKAGELVNKLALLGKPGLVFDVCEKEEVREQYQQAFETLRNLSAMGVNERLVLAETMSKNVSKTICDLELWIWLIHEKAVNNIRLYKVINKINNILKQIKNTNVNVKLALENLFLEL